MMHTDTMTDICRRIISALIKGRNVHEYTLAASVQMLLPSSLVGMLSLPLLSTLSRGW
jgi:hypothetical protein